MSEKKKVSENKKMYTKLFYDSPLREKNSQDKDLDFRHHQFP